VAPIGQKKRADLAAIDAEKNTSWAAVLDDAVVRRNRRNDLRSAEATWSAACRTRSGRSAADRGAANPDTGATDRAAA